MRRAGYRFRHIPQAHFAFDDDQRAYLAVGQCDSGLYDFIQGFEFFGRGEALQERGFAHLSKSSPDLRLEEDDDRNDQLRTRNSESANRWYRAAGTSKGPGL